MVVLELLVFEGIIKENIYWLIYVVLFYFEKWRGKVFICFFLKIFLFWFVVNVGIICGIIEYSLSIVVFA